MSAPTTNSDGKQVFKPETGVYFKPGLNDRDSYAGVIAALQDFEASKGRPTQSYPANFAGIISAIQNMTSAQFEPGSDAGQNPGGGTIDPETGDWIQTNPPPEGTLWFDTRQGRLFVYVSGAWFQTNGGDGFALLTASGNAPTFPGGIPAPGQFWYDVLSGSLYIHDGQFIDPDGTIVPPDTPGAAPLWRLINSVSSASFNTTTLVNSGSFTDTTYNFVVDLVAAGLVNQDEINQWLVAAVGDLDTELGQTDVIALTEPGTPEEGELWFDVANQVLKVYESGAWKTCCTPPVTESDIEALNDAINSESANRLSSIATLQTTLTNSVSSNADAITAVEVDVAALETTVNGISAVYSTKAENADLQTNLEAQISNITVTPPDLTPYALAADLSSLQADVNNLPTQESLNSVAANIPDVSNFVLQSHIDYTVNQELNSYMPLVGGTFTNGIAINRSSGYAIDLGGSASYSQQALRFTSNNPVGTSHAVFGANDKYWELAWDLDTKEDFCVRTGADHKKVFSVTEGGVAASTLFIGEFYDNSENGRRMHSVIDVKAAIQQLQADVAVLSNLAPSPTQFFANVPENTTDIDTLDTKVSALESQPRIYYSDDAPTVAADGDLWFQSNTMRLLVRHSNAWMNPDRVEDETHTSTSDLQDSLFNAISGATNFNELKIRLMTALST